MKRSLFAPDGSPLFTGIQVGALRIVIAALFLAPFALRKLALLKSGIFKYLLVIGLFGNAIPAFLFATAQTHIHSAISGSLNALAPIFTLIIAVFIFRVKVRYRQVIGIFIGLIASTGLILGSGQLNGAEMHYGYALLIVLGTICYAVSLNTIKQYLQDVPPVAITSLALVLVSPLGIIMLVGSNFFADAQALPGAWQGLGAIATLAIFGTSISLLIFNKLIQDTNTLFASSVTYLIPVVAIIWGILDGEPISSFQIACTATMLVGIIFINKK